MSRPAWLEPFLAVRELSALVVAILVVGVFTATNTLFLSAANIRTLSTYIAATAIVAAGEVMVLVLGEIDLSVAVVAAGSPYIVYQADQFGLPLILGLVLALLAAALVGLINGIAVVRLKVPSLIATLGTLMLVNGLTLLAFNAQPLAPPGSPGAKDLLGHGAYFEIMWAAVVVIAMQLLLKTTRWGLHTVAIGGNIVAARQTGIRVDFIRIGNFMLCAGLAGFAGILESMRADSIQPPHRDTDLMFFAVAGAVIGGTALKGGRGSVLGAAVGVSIIKALYDGLTLGGTNAFAFDAIVGVAIVGAMVLNSWVDRRRLGAKS
jgi:simple sugar transport system permease protein